MSTDSLKELLLIAPESDLDSRLHPLIQRWSEPIPTSLEVLEVLDQVIFCAAGSTFTATVLQVMYDGLLRRENISHEQNEAKATWRQ